MVDDFQSETGGATGIGVVTASWPLGIEPLCVAPVPPRRVAGQSKRAPCPVSKRLKLFAVQEAAIRGRADNRTLRELAADFGVSHETIRTVLRQHGSA